MAPLRLYRYFVIFKGGVVLSNHKYLEFVFAGLLLLPLGCNSSEQQEDSTADTDQGTGSDIVQDPQYLGDDECAKCAIVYTGAWADPDDVLYFTGYVLDYGAGCDCEDHTFLKRYHGEEWSTIYTYQGMGSLSAISGHSASDIYIAGSSGAVLFYDAQEVTSFDLGSDYESINFESIWVNDQNDVYVAGDDGVILHYDGASWNLENTGTTLNLKAIWGTSSTNVFATGDDGLLLHYDGNQWTTIETGTDVDLGGIWGTGPDNIYVVVGEDSPTPEDLKPGMIKHFDGTDWSETLDVGFDVLLDIGGNSQDDIYAVGALRGEDFEAVAVVWHFADGLWTRTEIENNNAFLWAVECDNSGQCYAVGTGNTFIPLPVK